MSPQDSEEENDYASTSKRNQTVPQDETEAALEPEDNGTRQDEVTAMAFNSNESWTCSQLFDSSLKSKRVNPARRELTKIMRLVSEELKVSSKQDRNYDKAVTEIMKQFAALKDHVEDKALRDRVGKTMILNSSRRADYHQRSLGAVKKSTAKTTVAKKNTVRNRRSVGLFLSAATYRKKIAMILKSLDTGSQELSGDGPTSWTAAQLLDRRKVGNPAWLALRDALREASDKYEVTQSRSKNFDKALREAMDQFEGLKPLMGNSEFRDILGGIMMANRHNRRCKRWKRRQRKLETSQLSQNKKGGPKKKKTKSVKVITVEDDSSVEESDDNGEPKVASDESGDSNAELEVDQNSNETSKPKLARFASAELYKMLSPDARKLVFNHQPLHTWQKLKKMLRISSDTLGLVGLSQDKALHAIKQILGAFPQLSPYQSNVEVQKTLQAKMYYNLQRRIADNRRRFAALCLQEEEEGAGPAEKQTNLLSSIKKITRFADIEDSSSSSEEEAAAKSRKDPHIINATMSCKGYPHKEWTRKEILSIDRKDRCSPPTAHYLKLMKDVSQTLGVLYKTDKHYETAITQVMNHFAALRPLVNVIKYRTAVGKRLTKNAQLRKTRWKRVREEREREQGELKGKKPPITSTKWEMTEIPKRSGIGRKRKLEESPPNLNECEVALKKSPFKESPSKKSPSKKTIQGYLHVQKKAGDLKGTLAATLQEDAITEPKRKKRRVLVDIQEKQRESKDDAVDLNTSGESVISPGGSHYKTGKKTLDDYLVVRKRVDMDNSLQQEDANEQKDVRPNLFDDFTDDVDDAFEDPPSDNSKADDDGWEDVESPPKGFLKKGKKRLARKKLTRKNLRNARKKVPPQKKGKFLVNVKSLCTKDELQESKLEGDESDVKVFSDWSLTGDTAESATDGTEEVTMRAASGDAGKLSRKREGDRKKIKLGAGKVDHKTRKNSCQGGEQLGDEDQENKENIEEELDDGGTDDKQSKGEMISQENWARIKLNKRGSKQNLLGFDKSGLSVVEGTSGGEDSMEDTDYEAEETLHKKQRVDEKSPGVVIGDEVGRGGEGGSSGVVRLTVEEVQENVLEGSQQQVDTCNIAKTFEEGGRQVVEEPQSEILTGKSQLDGKEKDEEDVEVCVIDSSSDDLPDVFPQEMEEEAAPTVGDDVPRENVDQQRECDDDVALEQIKEDLSDDGEQQEKPSKEDTRDTKVQKKKKKKKAINRPLVVHENRTVLKELAAFTDVQNY